MPIDGSCQWGPTTEGWATGPELLPPGTYYFVLALEADQVHRAMITLESHFPQVKVTGTTNGTSLFEAWPEDFGGGAFVWHRDDRYPQVQVSAGESVVRTVSNRGVAWFHGGDNLRTGGVPSVVTIVGPETTQAAIGGARLTNSPPGDYRFVLGERLTTLTRSPPVAVLGADVILP
ncbi:MAG TPA: hypothetical protein VNE62_06085 [Actinomycetota bacterium]|nr:hypothetical protein [Actinomycetota bacterium]